MSNHFFCNEAIYFGDARLTGLHRKLYRFMRPHTSLGHVPGQGLFWGDLCRERVRYVRSFIFGDINTLRLCSSMPYHDPLRPFVNYWYCSTEAANLETANKALTEAAQDPEFLALYDAAIERLGRALTGQDSWWARSLPQPPHRPIAYFSAEFALHQSLPIYAGGLGVLAGDHCKEASDLGIPLVGVGFMYPQGYFHQTMSPEGWQEELYEHLDWDYTPVEQAVTTELFGPLRPCSIDT